MKRFATANNAMLRSYFRTARDSAAQGSDRVFPNALMPVGTIPARADFAIDADCDCGGLNFFVRGIESYEGPPIMSVMRWLSEGTIHFETDEEAITWLRGDLALALGLATRQATAATVNATNAEAGAAPVRLLLDEGEVLVALQKQVRGQDRALKLMTERVVRHVARREPQRPGTMFSIGPTGVGKTKSALAMSEVLTELAPEGQGYAFLRLDMSEYQERHRVSQLIGSPQGYIGYGDGAQLVDALAANPRTIVLFDEIEKAHKEVLQALMNVMDAGRISAAAPTENGTREVDCRQAIFIFTSNLDADTILAEIGEQKIEDKQGEIDALIRRKLVERDMKRELVGRISCFLVYYPLQFGARGEIVRTAIIKAAAEYELKVTAIEAEVMRFLLETIDPGEFGARPYEYAVDNILGAAFLAAAKADLTGPLRLQMTDEEFACVAIPPAETAAAATIGGESSPGAESPDN